MKSSFKSILVGLATLTFAACANNSTTTNSTTTTQQSLITVKVASVGSDLDVWEYIATLEATTKAGLKIEAKEINTGPALNNAVIEGQVDANAFQSIGYMDTFNEKETQLVPAGTTYIEPMGIYSKKHKALSDLPNGATVAIPNDTSNGARALRLLQSAGLIKLSDKFNSGNGSIEDITENAKNLNIMLIDDTTSIRIMQDVDIITIGNTIALEGGLNVLKDSLFKEEANESTKTSINVITVKKGNENKPELQKLVELYHLPEVQKFISEKFQGTKVPVKKPVSEVWKAK